jgi:hypothetical protein
MKSKIPKKFRFDISIWSAVSAFTIQAVISAMITLTHFQRQREQAIKLIAEKGITLIRSLEAGLRSQDELGEDSFH